MKKGFRPALAVLLAAVSLLVLRPLPLPGADIDPVAYTTDIKAVNERIDKGDFEAARSRAALLKSKYPELIDTKLKNLDRIESMRTRCFERVNSGAAKVSMAEVSKRYAFAGDITAVDESGLKAGVKKGWNALTKEEVANFYLKAADPNNTEDWIAIAVFIVEGSTGEKEQEQALDLLGKAARLGADVTAHVKYVDTLKKAQEEYAEAEKEGKQLQTAEGAKNEKEKGKEGVIARSEATKQSDEVAASGAKQSHKDDETATGGQGRPRGDKGESSEPSGARSFDDAYVTTAATGDKIPHPLSKKAKTIIYMGKRVEVPEGMVYVPAGKFKMGENESEHEVFLDAYFIGKYEVTNAEWKAFIDATGYTPLPRHWKGADIPQGKENHPVTSISWEDAQKYCEWASKAAGLAGQAQQGRDVRLPTEAQWEKAARGPKGYEYPWGNSWDKRLCNSGWSLAPLGFRPNDKGDDWNKRYDEWQKSDKAKEINAAGGNTTPVGSFPKGKCFYGCYDMAGNASEWCLDWFITNYYKLKDAKRNPQGPNEEQAEEFDFSGKKSKARALRGGRWNLGSVACRTVFRSRFDPSYRGAGLYGFRVVVAAVR